MIYFIGNCFYVFMLIGKNKQMSCIRAEGDHFKDQEGFSVWTNHCLIKYSRNKANLPMKAIAGGKMPVCDTNWVLKIHL